MHIQYIAQFPPNIYAFTRRIYSPMISNCSPTQKRKACAYVWAMVMVLAMVMAMVMGMVTMLAMTVLAMRMVMGVGWSRLELLSATAFGVG